MSYGKEFIDKFETELIMEAVEKAMDEGEDFFNDLSEHQLLSLMKDKHWGAIRYWLEKRHPKFNTTKIAIDQPIEVAFTYHQKQ